MRGLLMALVTLDFPGYGAAVPRERARTFLLSTKTTAKKSTVTTV